jgi:WD40 repeat protein
VPSTDSDPGYEGPDWSIAFNNQVAKELDIEMIHLLSHGKRVYCVKFSPDGKYLAAACGDGKAYIYDVETGALTW